MDFCATDICHLTSFLLHSPAWRSEEGDNAAIPAVQLMAVKNRELAEKL
jgi:hypothetical protein